MRTLLRAALARSCGLARCLLAATALGTGFMDVHALPAPPAPSPQPSPSAQVVVKEPEGKVLFDYRTSRTHGPGQLELSDADRQRIVEAVKKAVVWDELHEKVWVNSAFAGSFSKRGAREAAYMLQPGGPRAMEPHSMADTVLAAFSGSRLVAVDQATGFNFIKQVEDVDGDGVDELLIDGSTMAFGALMTSAHLVRLRGKELEVVHEFGGVYEGACYGEQTMGVRAGVLRYGAEGKSGKPSFRVDVYGASCRPDGSDPGIEEYKYLPGEKIEW